MFGISDFIGLMISAFIILPIVIFLRELGYFLTSWMFGVKNPRLTIGSGPRLIQFGMLDIRKYYHLYSWFSFDSLKKDSNFAYLCVYTGPILINLTLALLINALLANGMIQHYYSFWDRFIFYAFYYLLFDCIPMMTFNGKPNNGMIIYELLRYGKRVDHNKEPFIPATSKIEKEYERKWKNKEL